jgi:hypothetical protein
LSAGPTVAAQSGLRQVTTSSGGVRRVTAPHRTSNVVTMRGLEGRSNSASNQNAADGAARIPSLTAAARSNLAEWQTGVQSYPATDEQDIEEIYAGSGSGVGVNVQHSLLGLYSGGAAPGPSTATQGGI